MSAVDGFDDGETTDTTAAGDGSNPRRPRRKRVLVSPFLLVALVLLVPATLGLLVLIRNATEPHAFSRYSVGTSGSGTRGEPGGRYTFGVADGPLPDVTVQSARAVLTKGSVAAATTVSICRGRELSSGIGSAEGDVSEWCSEVIPIDGQDLGEFGPDDSLIATVVPLDDGTVHGTGIHIEYRQGAREGSETFTISFSVDGSS